MNLQDTHSDHYLMKTYSQLGSERMKSDAFSKMDNLAEDEEEIESTLYYTPSCCELMFCCSGKPKNKSFRNDWRNRTGCTDWFVLWLN